MRQTRTPGPRCSLLQSVVAFALFAAACGGTESPSAEFKNDSSLATASSHRHARVCGNAAAGHMRCHAWVRVNDLTGEVQPFVTPSGFGPVDLAGRGDQSHHRQPRHRREHRSGARRQRGE